MREFIDAYTGRGKGKVNENTRRPEMEKEKANVVNIFKEYATSLTESGKIPGADPNMIRQFLKYIKTQFSIIQRDAARVSMEKRVIEILNDAFEKIQNEAKGLM